MRLCGYFVKVVFSVRSSTKLTPVSSTCARFKGDIERLCAAHKVAPAVQVTVLNDYRYRMNFSRTDWECIVAEEARAIDYTNFKNRVHDGTVRDEAYLNAWAAMRVGQEASKRG